MEDNIQPPPNLAELSVDEVYEAMQQFRIPEVVAYRFKEQQIDGEILSQMEAIPVALIPEIGFQIKFCSFYQFYSGKRIDYPNDYMIPQYKPIDESRNGGDDTIGGEMMNDYENVAPRKRRRLTQTQNGRYMAQPPPPPTTPPPTQQSLQPTLSSTPAVITPTSLVTQPKRQITYPAPLPVFSPLVESKLQEPSQALNAVMFMNRELIDFYISNNFNLSKITDYRYICETLLNKYAQLNQAVSSIVDLENRIRGRRVPTKPWQFLSKKLSCRHKYCKNKSRVKQFEHLKRDPLQEQQDNAIRQIENELTQTASPQTTDQNQLELVDADENNNNCPQQQQEQQQIENYYEEYESGNSNGDQPLLQAVDYNNNNNPNIENIVRSMSTQQMILSQEELEAANCIYLMSNHKNLNLLNVDHANGECSEANSDSNQQQFVNIQQNLNLIDIIKKEEIGAEIEQNNNEQQQQQQSIGDDLIVYEFDSQWVLNNLVNAVCELSQEKKGNGEDDDDQQVTVTESLLPNDNDIQTINRLAAQMDNDPQNSNDIVTPPSVD